MKIHPPTDPAVIKELLDKAHTVYYDDDPDCFVDIYDSPSLADANTCLLYTSDAADDTR